MGISVSELRPREVNFTRFKFYMKCGIRYRIAISQV